MDILQLATFPCALFLVLWAWVSLAAAKDEPETWRMRHTERGCTGSGCFYRFIIQEAQNTGDDGVYCEVSVSPVEVDHFSSKRCKEWTATNDPLETYRIDAERDLDTNDFIITVANMERQLSTTFSFSKEQWQAMQVPPDSINHRPGQQGWTWDFAGVAVSMFVGETVRSRSEDAAAKNRTIPDDLAPEVEKRAAPKREIWHLNKLCHYSELDSSLSMKVTRSFEIQESNTGTHGFKCRITTSSKTGLSWDSALCDEQDLGSMAWMYDATGTYSEDGTLFTIEVENMHKNRDKQRIAFFEIDAKVWNDAVYPNNIQSIEVVALPTLPDYNSGIMGRQWTIGEELEADTKDDIGGRRRTRVAPETLPRVSNVRIEASSPESRPLEVRRAHKRVFSRLRSPIEQGGLVDAPQWTTDGLTRDFNYDEELSLWSVDINFKLISTDLGGTMDTRPEAAATCHFLTYLQPDKNQRTESLWLRKCDYIDFFVSWGYVEGEDSAVVTLMYINPDKGGTSRRGWTSFQGVNDRTSFSFHAETSFTARACQVKATRGPPRLGGKVWGIRHRLRVSEYRPQALN